MRAILCSWCHSPAVLLCLDGDQCCAKPSCIAKYRADAEPEFERPSRELDSIEDVVAQMSKQVAAEAPKYGGLEALRRRVRLSRVEHLRVVK